MRQLALITACALLCSLHQRCSMVSADGYPEADGFWPDRREVGLGLSPHAALLCRCFYRVVPPIAQYLGKVVKGELGPTAHKASGSSTEPHVLLLSLITCYPPADQVQGQVCSSRCTTFGLWLETHLMTPTHLRQVKAKGEGAFVPQAEPGVEDDADLYSDAEDMDTAA